MKSSKSIFKSEKIELNRKDILSANFKIALVTGNRGGSYFGASVWEERFVEVWLKDKIQPETIWWREGEKFMEWYNKE
jgi:hypothetical protein